MSAESPTSEALAERLLDAQVAYHLERLDDDGVAGGFVARLTDLVLDGAGDQQLADLVDSDRLKNAVTRALTTAPAGAGAAALREVVRDVLRTGPAEPFPLSDVVEREQVEALLDALRDLTPAVERALERLTDNPLVGAMATQFMGRVVGELVQANQAVANRVPGLGSLFSLGLSAASGVAGAADKQLDGLLGGMLGDTVGKGGTLAVRRLNAVLVETLRDPTTRAAALQVWDMVAAEPVRGLGDRGSTDEVSAAASAAHDLVVTALAHPHTVSFAHAVIDTFLEQYGGYTPHELLVERGVDRADVAAAADRGAAPVVEALRESGVLERWLRAELEPFFRSDAVTAVLDER